MKRLVWLTLLVALAAAPAEANDSVGGFWRWLGAGWGPGIHASGSCPSCYGPASSWYYSPYGPQFAPQMPIVPEGTPEYLLPPSEPQGQQDWPAASRQRTARTPATHGYQYQTRPGDSARGGASFRIP